MHFGVFGIDDFQYFICHFFGVATAINVLIHQLELFGIDFGIRRVFVYGGVVTARGNISSIITWGNGGYLDAKLLYFHTQGFTHQKKCAFAGGIGSAEG